MKTIFPLYLMESFRGGLRQNALLVLLFCFSAISLISCQETNLDPAFITVDAMSVTANSDQGTSSSNIKTAWVFLNGLDLGVYNLPTTFPILDTNQEIDLQVRPGIANNGITDDSAIYPFYTGSAFTLNLAPFTTTVLEPNVGYRTNTIFRFIDDFEAGSLFNESDNSLAEWTLTNEPDLVLEGTRCAYVELNQVATSFEVTTLSFYTLPTDLTPVYLEMDYRGTASFEVGLRGVNSNFQAQTLPVVFVGKQEEWNKIYINYTDIIAQLFANGFTQYQVVFSGNLPNGETTADYYFDNIKLVYR